MVEDDESRRPSTQQEGFSRAIGAQERRKLHARRNRAPVWLGLGMLGVVGWSVGAPTLLGALLGMWLDRHHPGTRSWTLSLLLAGLFVGCMNVWHWIAREQSAIHREEEENDQ
jgi:ATP synthase protein I